MARVAIAPTKITLDGVTIDAAGSGTAGDATNGNSVTNNGSTTFVVVANTSVDTAYDVTFVTPGTVGTEAYAVADKVEEIAFGTEKTFGPFPLAVFTKTLQIDVENAALLIQPFYI